MNLSWRSLRRRVRPLFFLAAAGSGLACNLLFDFEQCNSDADCSRFAEADGSSPYVCSSEKICVSATENRCLQTECSAMGENMVCGASGECVQATSDVCPTLYPNDRGSLDRDNVIVVGSVLPTQGDLAAFGAPQEKALQMAIDEFNESGAIGDLRFVHIGCAQDITGEVAIESAKHLTEVVGVPAVFGPAFSGIFLEVTTSVTVPNGVFAISSSATSSNITDIDDNGLVWRTAASDAFQSVAIADRIRDLQSASETPLKVAAFGKDDVYGKGLLFAVAEELGPVLGDDNFFTKTYPVSDNADLDQAVVDAMSEYFDDADVVVLFGTGEILDLLAAYELYLVDHDLPHTPRYIMSDGGRTEETLTFLQGQRQPTPPPEVIARLPDIMPRIEGTVAALENGTIYSGFRQRYRAKWTDEPGIYASNGYDAAYLTLYALAKLRARDEALTGPNIAQVMGKMLEGPTIEAGPGQLRPAITALASNSGINFEGASGPLDFDLVTGEAPSNINRWVIETDDGGQLQFAEAGQYVVAAGGAGTWNGIPE